MLGANKIRKAALQEKDIADMQFTVSQQHALQQKNRLTKAWLH